MRDLLDQFVEFVTTHNRVVILVMLLLTAGMVVGMGQMETQSQAEEDSLFPETEASIAADHIEAAYGEEEPQGSIAAVYIHEPNGNALSKESLIASLRYENAVRADAAVAESLSGEPRSVAAMVASEISGESDLTLEEQRAVLESATSDSIAAAIDTIASSPETRSEFLALLPESYTAGEAQAASQRLLFQFAQSDGGRPASEVQRTLFEEARDRSTFFTLGEHAMSEASTTMNTNTMQLVVPLALALVVLVLAVTYRNLVDIMVGLVGVLVSVLWMFGILGWLGISAGMTMIIGPVLIAGLSIDFSFHVFNRYRENRDADDEIRPSMREGLRSVAVALLLVTITAAIGFLSNLVNPVGMIRNLGIGITLGVISALIVFTTLVPALKISIDGVLERFGLERRAAPLGHGRYLRPFLQNATALARRAAPVVIVAALVVGGVGAMAWTTIEEESFQQQSEPAAEWKQDLPGSLAWEDPAFNTNQRYVQTEYQAIAADSGARFQLLIDGAVTSDGTLQAVERVTDAPVFTRATQPTRSPMTVIDSVASENEAFADTVAAADTDGDGIPDTEIGTVYDHLYEVAPDRASQVIERSDGEYQSLRIVGPAESAGPQDTRGEDIAAAASSLEADNPQLSATAVGESVILKEGLAAVTDGVLRVLLVALGAVSVALIGFFHRLHGRPALGAVTAIPIVLVTGFVIGGMAVLDVPLTLVTALLMSLVIGLGIDYNIHITDRFVQELERGRGGFDALETAVTGTGGALLGSALSSGGAFIALLIHPHPQIESFGILVILALLAAFLVSVFVLPSMLTLWWRYHGLEHSKTGMKTSRSPATD